MTEYFRQRRTLCVVKGLLEKDTEHGGTTYLFGKMPYAVAGELQEAPGRSFSYKHLLSSRKRRQSPHVSEQRTPYDYQERCLRLGGVHSEVGVSYPLLTVRPNAPSETNWKGKGVSRRKKNKAAVGEQETDIRP